MPANFVRNTRDKHINCLPHHINKCWPGWQSTRTVTNQTIPNNTGDILVNGLVITSVPIKPFLGSLSSVTTKWLVQFTLLTVYNSQDLCYKAVCIIYEQWTFCWSLQKQILVGKAFAVTVVFVCVIMLSAKYSNSSVCIHQAGTSAGHYYRGCSPVIHSGKVDKCDVIFRREDSRTQEICLCNSHLCNRVTSLRCSWQHWATVVVTMASLSLYVTWIICSIGCGPDGSEADADSI